MDSFEVLLEAEWQAVERFVRFRINNKADADDVLQEVYLAACQNFSQLKRRDSFKAWMISIARNKCNDHFRRKANLYEIPIDELKESELSDSRQGRCVITAVRETLDLLGDKDKQILYLYFWKELSQAEIAKRLNIPEGTVKSRLHYAKQNFKNKYPCCTGTTKGENDMKKLPELLPGYTITESDKAPFSVKWEELMGWFLIPKPGEKLTWGTYDIPTRKCSHIYDMQVTGKARVHGIEGVELTARETCCPDRKHRLIRTFVAQLTDTHCRYLAAIRSHGEVRDYVTFLDGEEFLSVWGFGEDNIGNETDLRAKGKILRTGNSIIADISEDLFDVVGRYHVKIGEKTYDTVCAMNVQGGIAVEQYVDGNGRTVLWRRFNEDTWAVDRYQKNWSELLPKNDRITINGKTYVHWYDCITDYIL